MAYWYAIQCVSGKEEPVRKKLRAKYEKYETYIPKREMVIRRAGNLLNETKPIFPGYLFIKSTSKLIYQEAAALVKKINDFSSTAPIYKVIGMNRDDDSVGSEEVSPVLQSEMDVLLQMTGDAETVSVSGYHKVGDKVSIVRGPLQGLEALVVKINARKKRLKLLLTMCGQEQEIDFPAEMIS